jgi:hypothetical protein
MAKNMSNSKRAKERRNREQKVLFQEALAEGKTSRRDICKLMGITTYQLTGFFELNPKSYKIYSSRRRELVDTAADNLQDIVEDKTHPQFFQASKYVLEHYKTDLDNILDVKDDGGLEGGSSVSVDVGSGTIIKFTKEKEKEKED